MAVQSGTATAGGVGTATLSPGAQYNEVYDYYLDTGGTLNRWMRSGTGGGGNPTAPNTPSSFAVTWNAAGTVATLTWVTPSSDGGSPITGYTVTLTGGATHTLGVVLTDSYSSLTAGTTYTWTVAAVNAVGTGSAVTVSSSSSTPVTQWGYNHDDTVAHSSLTYRKTEFDGRNPCPRIYGAFADILTHVYNPPADTENCACWSFKDSGHSAGLAAGTYNNDMKLWLQSLPAGQILYWCYYHEVNTAAGAFAVPVSEYLATYHNMRLALNSATLQPGVKVYITFNFEMSPTPLANFNDAWVPPRADADIFTIDAYGNPSGYTGAANKYGGPSTGAAYGNLYPIVSTRLAGAFTIIQRNGYADSWGVLEFNSPQRDWDCPPSAGGTSVGQESGRLGWHQDYVNLIQSPPMTGHVPAKIALIWENGIVPQATWDQSYGRLDGNTTRMVNLLKPFVESSPQ